MRTSQVDRAHCVDDVGAKMSAWAKEICAPAVGRSARVVRLWRRLRAASAVAGGEMSMPWRWREGM